MTADLVAGARRIRLGIAQVCEEVDRWNRGFEGEGSGVREPLRLPRGKLAKVDARLVAYLRTAEGTAGRTAQGVLL
jgi:hypothetical protein